MRNTQLFEILGEIDNKFYDEALGGDTEKPLKIDTSRKPLKWYRIAAPIAACLVLGAGIFTVSRFLDRSGVVKPPITSDDPINHGFVSANEADLDACKQLLLEKYPSIEGFSTRIMDINFDGIDEAVVRPYGGDSIVHIFSKYNGKMTETGCIDTEPYEYCIGDLSELKEYDPSVHLESGNRYWYFHFKSENKDAQMLAEAVARINYSSSSYTIDFPVAAYATGYTGSNIDNLILKKNWQYSYNSQGSFIESGTDISRDEFNSLWNKHIPYEELDASFIEYLEKDDIPYLDLDNVPLMNSASFEADQSPVIKRALIEGIHYGDRAYAYLAGENIFKLAEDGSDYIRMDRMFVVFYRQNLPNEYVYLDPISEDNTDGSHGNIVTRTYKYQQNYTFELYQLDDVDIIVIGNNEYIRSDGANCNFVAMTRDGRFILLKGTGINGDTVSPRVSTSNKLEVSGNSLYDPANGVNFTFFPEMFDYADPDAEHAHFTCAAYAPEVSVKGGYVYSSANDSDSIPKKEVYENVGGTQEDLDRWNSYISSVEPAVIHAADRGKYTHALPDSEAEKLLNMVRSVELGLIDDVKDDDWEWDIIGCDSEGSVLFTAHYNGVWLKVTFDDSGKSYTFVSDTSMKAIISILE